MGQKVNPIGLRVGINRGWDSVWYSKENFRENLHEDIMLRRELKKRFKTAGIVRIVIERFPEKVNVNIHTVRPGLVIGPRGATIEAVKAEMKKKVARPLNISIIEVKKPETISRIVSEGICQQLEQRMPFRRVMKQALRGAMRGGVEGIKIMVSGRLNGADMARTEQYKDGRVPLHTLRAKIEYAHSEAKTTFGIIGVKVWTYHGDFFPGMEKEEEETFTPKRRPS